MRSPFRKSQDYTFETVFTPQEAIDKTIVWDCNDTSIVSIEQNGTITAKTIGEVNITATSTFDNTIQASAIVIVDREIAQIVVGGSHSVILDTKGDVWTTGLNENGQLGAGNNDDNPSFVKAKYLKNIKSIAAGKAHTLAVDNDGNIWATGDNTYGQLGSEDLVSRNRFRRIADEVVAVSVAAGQNHSVALDSEGNVWVTGSNSNGQAGLGDILSYEDRFRKLLYIDSISSVFANYDNTFAVNSAGEVWATGGNTFGQLGIGNTANATNFAKSIGVSDVTSVAVGSSSAYILDANGNVWASGDNGVGRLGVAGDEEQYSQFLLAIKDIYWEGTVQTPIKQVVPLTNIKEIYASYDYALALDNNGDLWVAPDIGNSLLNVDIEALINYVAACEAVWKPVLTYAPAFCYQRGIFSKVTNISNVKSVAAGDMTILALKEDGSLWAAGQNQYGQLGFGDNESRYAFEKVPLPQIVICQEGQYFDEATNTCKLSSTAIYFVNGIFNTEESALVSKEAIEKGYSEVLHYLYNQESIEFKLSYNYHYGNAKDLQEVFWQKIKESGYDEDFAANYFLAWLRVARPEDAVLFVAQGLINALAAQPEIIIAEQNNLTEMKQEYLNAISKEKRIILIAHSQGNLYANQSMRFLRETLSDYSAKYVRMLGVASPAAVTGDPYITACDDIVIFGLSKSPYYSILPCNLTNKPSGEDFREFSNHEFIVSYLDKRLPSGKTIASKFYEFLDEWASSQTQP